MRFYRLKIKGKILLALMLLSVLTFGVMFALSTVNIKGLGGYAIEKCRFLGSSAVNDSKKALYEQSQKELYSRAMDQAYITNLQLDRIAGEVKLIASIYSEVNRRPASNKDNILLSSEKPKPADLTAFSAYKLAPGVKPELVQYELGCLSRMHNVFKLTKALNSNIRLVYIGTQSGIIMKYPWMPTPPSYDPRKRVWFMDAIRCKKVCWTAPYAAASYNELVITCCMPIFSDDDKPLAVAAIDVSVKGISDNFTDTQRERYGNAFIVDKAGNVIVFQGMQNSSLKWNEPYNTRNLLNAEDPQLKMLGKKMTSGESGIFTCEFNGQENYVAYAPVLSTGWCIGIASLKQDVIKPALVTETKIKTETEATGNYIIAYQNDKRMIYVFVAGGILIVILVTGVWISRKITKPITELAAGAREIGNGNLEHRIYLNSGDEIEALATTFNHMTDDLKLYIKNLQETVAAKERIEGDLKVATDIQASMLPRIFPAFPDRKEIDIFASMEPAKEVGGDFYDFFFIDEKRLYFCIGDVSGKGVPAALFMAIAKTLMKGEVLAGASPEEILLHVNNSLEPDNDSCMFATTFCGILDTSTGELIYSNAGHNPPLLYSAGGSYRYMEIDKGFVIGPMPAEPGRYTLGKCTLNHGDVIFLYSDGVTEAMDPDKTLFSDAALEKELNVLKAKNVTEQINGIREAVNIHASGEPQSDDITMLALKYN
jgi:sigma-B regulation protein RsbU (phosphoserine phosphatase)